MFKSYFKTALRHLLKSKVNFLFKLGGLTIALFSFLIIVIYVSFQWSFDKFNDDYENIYRVNSNRYVNGKMEDYAMVPPGVGPGLKSEFPEVKSFSRLTYVGTTIIKYNDKLLRVKGLAEADSSVFSVFDFRFIKGERHPLDRPGTIVLTRSLSEQIFGDEDPIGKTIILQEKHASVEVTAVVEDLPSNTHLKFSALLPFPLNNVNPWSVTWDGSVYLYVKMYPDADPVLLSKKTASMIARNIVKSDEGSEKNFALFFQPVSEVYLGPNLQMEFHEKGSGFYVYIFSVLGFFLLVIASINYVNLSIADFHRRSKEIGVRKILGARKKQITIQVITESVFFCLSALLISVLILYSLFPNIVTMLDSRLSFDMLFRSDVLIWTGFTLLFLVLFSTVYPALRLGVNNPVKDIKTLSGFGGRPSTAKTLLIAQFIISILCITATLVVGDQVSYIKTTDVGYDRSGVITLVMPDEFPTEKVSVLKNELTQLPGVESVSYSYYHMTGVPYFKNWYRVEMEGEMKQIELNEVFVDHDYLRTMGIQLIEGRNFDPSNAADRHTAFIINETAARYLGWTQPIGKRIKFGYQDEKGERWEGTVVGVVKDFNTRSLREKIEPLVIRLQYDSWPGYALNIKVKGEVASSLPAVKAVYERVLPGLLADYKLVSDMYDRQYENENKALTALKFGTWIIVVISCLGVFSLSIYMSMRRMKEFGIRKMVGASSIDVTLLHVGYFLRVVLIANIIAVPVAYGMMNEWLDGFVYRTDLSSRIFLFVATISVLLVIVSASYSSIKAGRMNPVDVIKIQ